MDIGWLSAQDLLQLHSIINHIQQPTGGQGSSGTAQDHHIIPGVTTAHDPGNPPIPPPHTNLNTNYLQQTTNPVIYSMPTDQVQPYQSVHTTHVLPAAPQGHPSPTVSLTALHSPSSEAIPSPSIWQVKWIRSAVHLKLFIFLDSRQSQPMGPDVAMALELQPHLWPMDHILMTVQSVSPTKMESTFYLYLSKSRCTSHNWVLIYYLPWLGGFEPRVTFQEVISEDPFVYSLFHHSFNTELQSHGLIHSFKMPISTAITSLILCTVTNMQDSPYQFSSSESCSQFLLHEVLPLQLLSFINRGYIIPLITRSNCSGLVIVSQTIESLAFNHMNYAIPALAIEGNHFVIHMGK